MDLKSQPPRKAEMVLEFQNYIQEAPFSPPHLYAQACSSDTVTVDTWRKIWVDQARANKAKYGSFKDNGVGKLFGLHKNKPAIIAGAGPSLKHNAHWLREKGEIPLVSCLHNFHFLEDLGIETDFYVTLDAGEVTIEEVSEGGKRSPEEYWALTEKRTLLAYIGTHPKLLEKWRGKVLFFNVPVPDADMMAEFEAIEPFNTYITTGGCVLGACLSLAKAIMGCNPIAYIGADFSFSYDKKFHGWDSKYDKDLGNCVRMTDVFGHRVLSWQSYANFKAYFDYIAISKPGIYINCTEGGTLGSYDTGNIVAIRQMSLHQFLVMYRMYEDLKDQCLTPETAEKKILF